MMDETSSILGFIGSHSSLCNLVQKNTFEVMLTRSVAHYDQKGIVEPLKDVKNENLYQIFYVSNDPHDFLSSKSKLDDIVNEPVLISYRG